MTALKGVDLEIVGRPARSTDGRASTAMFRRVRSLRINGEEVVCPEGAQLTISGQLGVEPLTVSLEMLARSVSIRVEEETDTDTDTGRDTGTDTGSVRLSAMTLERALARRVVEARRAECQAKTNEDKDFWRGYATALRWVQTA